MAETIGRAVVEITLDDKQYRFALNEVEKQSDKTADHIRGISQAVNLKVFEEWGKVAVNAIGKVVGEIIELGNRGAAVSDVAGSFQTLAEKAGSTGDAMLGQLRAGVVGTLSDFELMKLANKTLGSGLVKSAEDMGVLSAGARALAKATGGTTAEAFDTLTSAMASGRTATLKQLGLFVDSKKATEEFAAAHGKTVSELTDADRAQALAAASLQALRDRMREIPPDAADFGEKIEQAKVVLENFYDQVAVGVSQSPVLAAGLDTIGKAFSLTFGSNQQAQVRAVVSVVEDLVIGLTYVAQGAAIGATVFVTAWYAVKTLILAVETAILLTFNTVVRMTEGLANFAAKMPWVTKESAAAAAGVTDLRKSLDAATASLAAQTAEAAKGVIGQSELQAKIDKVSGAIVLVRDAMEELKAKSPELAPAVKTAFDAIGTGADDAHTRSVQATNAIRDAFFALTRDIVLDTKTGNEKRLAELEFAKQAEIQKARETKEITATELTAQIALIEQKYAQRVAIVNASVDQIKAKELALQQEIAIADAVGTEQRLLQIEARKNADLAAIAELQVTNQVAYNTLSALIREKYAQATAFALGHYSSVEQAAAAAGFKTRAQLEEQLQKARQVYAEMLTSGKFTDAELLKAHEAAKKAEAELDGKVYQTKAELQDVLLSSVSSTLRSMFGKNKAFAITAALLDTYAAVAKALSAYPWPFNLAPAAAAFAAGMAQVRNIRSQNGEGFAAGTPGLDFAAFGPASLEILHGNEAVVPQGSGHLLAAEIAAAMPGSDAESAGMLQRIEASLNALPRMIGRAVRDGLILAT